MFAVVVIISSTDPVHELTSCASHTPSIHMKVPEANDDDDYNHDVTFTLLRSSPVVSRVSASAQREYSCVANVRALRRIKRTICFPIKHQKRNSCTWLIIVYEEVEVGWGVSNLELSRFMRIDNIVNARRCGWSDTIDWWCSPNEHTCTIRLKMHFLMGATRTRALVTSITI